MDVTSCCTAAASHGLLYALVVCQMAVLRVSEHTRLACIQCRRSLLINNHVTAVTNDQ